MRHGALTRLVLCVSIAFVCLAASARADDPAKLGPDDTMVYAVVPNFQALFDKFKETSLYGLYRDPAMQPCVGPSEKKITALIDEKLGELWAEIGVKDAPKELPWPQGQVSLYLRMTSQKRQIRVPDYEAWQKGDRNKFKMEETTDTEPAVVVLAEMGKNAAALKELIAKGIDTGVEKGAIRKVRETVRGVDIDVLVPKSEDKDAKPVEPGSEPMPCVGFKGQLCIFGSDLALVKDVLTRMAGGDQASLADDAGYKAVRAALGDSAQVSFYFSVKAAIDFAKKTADADDKAEIIKMMSVLGFDNVLGIGATFEMAPNKTIDTRLRVQVAIRGEKTGLPALLTPTAGPAKPGSLLGRNVAGFLVANYDLSKMFDQVIKMIEGASGENADKALEEAMNETRGEGENAKPPVNLRKEVFGQLTAPLTFAWQLDRPITAASGGQFVLGLGARDAKVLDTAMGRIHDTFLARGNKDLRRELNGTKVYEIPNILGMMLGVPGDSLKMAFAVPGNQFTFGSLKWVEQSAREVGKDKPESVTDDPMYQHAAKFLPAQVGLFAYINGQISGETIWVQLKEAARQAAKEPKDDAEPKRPVIERDAYRRMMCMQPVREPGGSGAPSLFLPTVRDMKDYIDFTTLPEFSAVKKHFGPTVLHLSGNDQGVGLELLGLRAPAAE